jgi:hypothetical protein
MPHPKLKTLFRVLLKCAMVFALLTGLVVGCCAPLVWLPDIIQPHDWKCHAAATLPDGQELRVMQRWGFDFYETVIAVKENGRYTGAYYIDGDDSKLWTSRIEVDPASGRATITLLRNRVFTYCWAQRLMLHEGRAWCCSDPEDLQA